PASHRLTGTAITHSSSTISAELLIPTPEILQPLMHLDTMSLNKTTLVFSQRTIPLECDVYSSTEYPLIAPVFLYFHSGGLVSGSRECVPPWLVQVCFKNQWTLISASYRMLPQAKASGLLQDATDAYSFALRWAITNELAPNRKVIVGGSSAGVTSANNPQVFHVEKILPDGAKNTAFVLPPLSISDDGNCDEFPRGCLYDYYLYRNEFLNLVGEIDPGYEWAESEMGESRAAAWPPTTIIQGDADEDVDLSPHLYEATRFIEDDMSGMDAVRQAVSNLEADVARALA
ncbi:uncharacterized protein CCOS01_10336, partial [Colletotrichum costaricense]